MTCTCTLSIPTAHRAMTPLEAREYWRDVRERADADDARFAVIDAAGSTGLEREEMNSKCEDEMAKALANFPVECWLIHGTLSNGGLYYSRRFSRAEAEESARFSNANGASVTVTRQTQQPTDLLWTDAGDNKG